MAVLISRPGMSRRSVELGTFMAGKVRLLLTAGLLALSDERHLEVDIGSPRVLA
jgi:hypothetical protein